MKTEDLLLISFLGYFLFFNNKSIAGIGAIKKIKWSAPYLSDGKTTFKNALNKSGVYLIKENGKVVYVGYSGNNLYRTMYRHFQQWTAGQHVVSYANRLKRNDYKVRVIYCTATQAGKLEKALIHKHQPRDNNKVDNSYEIDNSTSDLLDILTNKEEEAPF